METWIPYKWPLALDILKRQFDALPDQRILLFQSQYFNSIGPNMTFKLFGSQGYLTADPKNVESILSTKFEGSIPNSVPVRSCLTSHQIGALAPGGLDSCLC
jgi:hypothetical protein